MNFRLLTTPLVAILFLFSVLGCHKDDEPTPVGTGSYKLDGTSITCEATAYVSTDTSTGTAYDYLELWLTTMPQPASGAEVLRLYFKKPTGQPASAYQLTVIERRNGAAPTGIIFANDATTLNATNSTTFSGTFSAKNITLVGTTSQTTHVISDGVFTTAHL